MGTLLNGCQLSQNKTLPFLERVISKVFKRAERRCTCVWAVYLVIYETALEDFVAAARFRSWSNPSLSYIWEQAVGSLLFFSSSLDLTHLEAQSEARCR
jgi:hypothetical protein